MINEITKIMPSKRSAGVNTISPRGGHRVNCDTITIMGKIPEGERPENHRPVPLSKVESEVLRGGEMWTDYIDKLELD